MNKKLLIKNWILLSEPCWINVAFSISTNKISMDVLNDYYNSKCTRSTIFVISAKVII